MPSPRRGRTTRCTGPAHHLPLATLELQQADDPALDLPGPPDAPLVVVQWPRLPMNVPGCGSATIWPNGVTRFCLGIASSLRSFRAGRRVAGAGLRPVSLAPGRRPQVWRRRGQQAEVYRGLASGRSGCRRSPARPPESATRRRRSPVRHHDHAEAQVVVLVLRPPAETLRRAAVIRPEAPRPAAQHARLVPFCGPFGSRLGLFA